jgi:hypothetical protein
VRKSIENQTEYHFKVCYPEFPYKLYFDIKKFKHPSNICTDVNRKKENYFIWNDFGRRQKKQKIKNRIRNKEGLSCRLIHCDYELYSISNNFQSNQKKTLS